MQYVLSLQAAWDAHSCVGAADVGDGLVGAAVVGKEVTGEEVDAAGRGTTNAV